MALNPDFFEPVIDVTVPASEFISDSPLETGDYFWRTCWQDVNGKWSVWGPVSSFMVQHGWDTIPLPFTPEAGAAMCYAEKDIDSINQVVVPGLYILVGGNNTGFYRYRPDLPANQALEMLRPTPMSQRPGSSITSHDWSSLGLQRIYAIFGGTPGDTLYLYRYLTKYNRWEVEDHRPLPRACGYGSCIAKDDRHIFLTLVIAGEYETTNFYENPNVFDPESENNEGGMATTDEEMLTPAVKLTSRGALISYFIDKPGYVNAAVFDAIGRKVINLAAEYQSGGGHTLEWHLTDSYGRKVGAGIFFVHLDIDGKRYVLKTTVW